MSERGSVTVVAAGLLFFLAVFVTGCADVARVLAAASRAQTAADAAALAAAQDLVAPGPAGPEVIAAEYAERNGAELVSCDCPTGASEAVVEVQRSVEGLFLLAGSRVVRASARAVAGAEGPTASTASPGP